MKIATTTTVAMMIVLALASNTSSGYRYKLHDGCIPLCGGGIGYWKHGFGGGGYLGHGYGKKMKIFSHIYGKNGRKRYAGGFGIAPGAIHGHGFHGGYYGGYGDLGWW